MNTRKFEVWILLADLAWIAAAFLGADLLRFGLTWLPDERVSIRALLPFVIASGVLWLVLSLFMPMDGYRRGWKLSNVLSQLLVGTLCTFATLLTLAYLMRSYVSRLALGYFVCLMIAGFVAIRCLARLFLRWRHRDGDLWRVVILGCGREAQEVATKIEQHPEMLCKVVGMLFPDSSAEELVLPGLFAEQSRLLQTLDIFELLREMRVNEVILAFSHQLTPEIRTLVGRIRDMGVQTSLVPQSYELYASRPRLVRIDELPLIQLRDPDLSVRYLTLKRCLDICIATLSIIPAWLFLLPFALVLRLKKGRAFRVETRSGHYGKPFAMLRLNLDRPVRTDSRFELLIERMSITELPQLWNVLMGEMSLVGPRPDPLVRSSQYSDWHQRRLKVKPGMTGLAQVRGLREFSSPEEKTRLDLQYAVNPYLFWDISLLLETLWTLWLRIWSAPRRGTFDVHFKSEPLGGVPDAHRTQSSAD